MPDIIVDQTYKDLFLKGSKFRCEKHTYSAYVSDSGIPLFVERVDNHGETSFHSSIEKMDDEGFDWAMLIFGNVHQGRVLFSEIDFIDEKIMLALKKYPDDTIWNDLTIGDTYPFSF